MVKINGKEENAAGKTLAAYLSEAGYDASRVAVERNESIVAKKDYGSTVLRDGDNIEIVRFVGGG
ncbi:MAG: sulfur carrier protein ThiS [Bacillota bacterium]|jgi:thiamine biosynthesis protein ThiS